MGKLQTTDPEEWEEIGEKVKQVNRDVVALTSELNSIPKSEWNDAHRKACEGMSELKHLLEERMAEEHPNDWDTEVFYGDAGEPSWRE